MSEEATKRNLIQDAANPDKGSLSSFFERLPEIGCLLGSAICVIIGRSVSFFDKENHVLFFYWGLAAILAVIAALILLGRMVIKFPRLALFFALAGAFHTFGISIFVYAAIAVWVASLNR